MKLFFENYWDEWEKANDFHPVDDGFDAARRSFQRYFGGDKITDKVKQRVEDLILLYQDICSLLDDFIAEIQRRGYVVTSEKSVESLNVHIYISLIPKFWSKGFLFFAYLPGTQIDISSVKSKIDEILEMYPAINSAKINNNYKLLRKNVSSSGLKNLVISPERLESSNSVICSVGTRRSSSKKLEVNLAGDSIPSPEELVNEMGTAYADAVEKDRVTRNARNREVYKTTLTSSRGWQITNQVANKLSHDYGIDCVTESSGQNGYYTYEIHAEGIGCVFMVNEQDVVYNYSPDEYKEYAYSEAAKNIKNNTTV